MTKSTDKTTQRPTVDFPVPQFDMPAFNGNMFSAYARASAVLLENAAAMNREIVRFANKRLEADAKLLQELPTCTSWEKSVKVQSDFARAASEAYSEEIPKLMEQGAKCCATAMAPMMETVNIPPESEPKP